MNPYKLLKDAIKAVPSIKYALGVAGIAAAVAIILGFIKDPKIAVFGIVITIGLMFILVIFSHAVKNIPGVGWLAAVLAWSMAILFILSITSVFTAFAFGYPATLAFYFRDKPSRDNPSDLLVGTWRFTGVELGQPRDIVWHLRPDGTETYIINGVSQGAGTWQYIDAHIYERYPDGRKGKGAIQIRDRDHFEITIVDNGIPAQTGLRRLYVRE